MDTRAIAELAHPIFVANGWEWCTTAGVPGVEAIQETIDHLIERVEESPDVRYSATGRFRVCRFEEPDGSGHEITVTLELGGEFR